MTAPSSPIDALRERARQAVPLALVLGESTANRHLIADAVLDALGLEQVGWLAPNGLSVTRLWAIKVHDDDVPVYRLSPGEETE